MIEEFLYDISRNPPAPVLPLRIWGPGRAPPVLLSALVDTGADMTVIPSGIAQHLELPAMGEVSIAGVGASFALALSYGAQIEAAGIHLFVRVLGVGEEALVGRDVLNEWTTILRGPRRTMEVVREG